MTVIASRNGADTAKLPPKGRRTHTRGGKARLVSLDNLDRRTAVYKAVAKRIKLIEEEQFGGEPTHDQHQSVVNSVLLEAVIESRGVQHLLDPSMNPKRLEGLINAQRQERKLHND
jgi:hypothetical protein